jgi:hypothetical protein
MATKHRITLDKAKQLTKKYRDNKKKILKDEYGNKPTLPICETYERAAFEELLAVRGCVGIRAYFSMNEGLDVNLIFVAVNDKNEDILPEEQILPEGDTTMLAKADDDDVPVIGGGTRCPEYCPPPSPLN